MTWDFEITERELMECANAAFFYNRPDLQYRFDGSAPPLIPSQDRSPKGGDAQQGSTRSARAGNSSKTYRNPSQEGQVE
jgi:hypothetical protein